MPIAQFLFSETSPSSASTAVSSQPVAGSSAGIPNGVAGLLDDYEALLITADLVGATGGTLDVSIESSPDGGINWYEAAHYPQLANGAAAVSYSSPISLATATSAPVVVGKNTTSALTANKVVSGAWGDRLRLLMVAGSGTSAGAQVTVRVLGQRSRRREAGGR